MKEELNESEINEQLSKYLLDNQEQIDKALDQGFKDMVLFGECKFHVETKDGKTTITDL